jgi:hypothetical protein
MRPVALLLACLSAGACRDAGEAPAPEVPLDLTGSWTIVGHHLPGVSAMSEADAARWRGRTLRLGEAAAAGGGDPCASPSYTTRIVPRDSLLTTEYRLTSDKLSRAGLAERVTVLDVSCAGEPWPAMGGRLIGIGADRALAPWDGVFFELARDDDYRAVGQEPGWQLAIEGSRQIRFIYDYGADTALTPVPAAARDSATGALTYHATTEAHDLRVVLTPSPCTDAMSGQPYETTVTVALDGRTYHGCGGPLP